MVYNVIGETSNGLVLNGVDDDMFVKDGGSAVNTVINSGGELTVSSGGTADTTTVNYGGNLYVYYGGSSLNITENGGYVYIDGMIDLDSPDVSFTPNSFSDLSLSGEVTATVHSGTTAFNPTIDSGAEMDVYSGGTAVSATVNVGGALRIYQGTATEIIENGGYVFDDGINTTYVSNTISGLVLSSTEFTAQSATVHSGTTAVSTTLNSKTIMEVHSGGSASATTVNLGGRLFVRDNGIAQEILENGGYVACDEEANVTFTPHTISGLVLSNWYDASLHSGTVADGVTVASAMLHVFSGGLADIVVIGDGGSMEVWEGGCANTVEVNSGGCLYVDPDAVVYDAALNAFGMMNVHSDSLAVNTTVNSDGNLSVMAGGIVSGLQIEAGADVSMDNGAIVLFDLTGRTTSDAAMVNDLSLIDGTPDYTITVSASQAAGVYALADGANDFNSTITVGTAETNYGTVSLGGAELKHGNYQYALSSSDGQLKLTVSISTPEPAPAPDPTPAPEPTPAPAPVGPAAPKASADITAATTKDVTVSATFGNDAAIKQYSLDGKSWQDYTGGILMKDNGTVWFRAGNDDGYSEAVSYEVTNIDRVPPVKPVATADITGSTKQNVTVSAVFSEDTAKKQYSFDNLVWNTYTSGVVFSRNGSVYFRGIDEVGNISDVTGFTVGNIQADQYEIAGDQTSSKTVNLSASGKYMLSGSFGSDVSGSVTVLNGGKKAGSGSIKDGVLTFNKGKPVLLDSSLSTEIQVSIKKGTQTAYDLHLDAESVFPAYDPAGSDPKSALSLGTASFAGQELVPAGWVGYGDETDYYAVTLESGANFSLTCTSTDAMKLTLYSAATGKPVLSSSIKGEGTVTAKPKLLEAGDYYLAVQSANAKKGGSADYSVSVSEDTVFFTKGDNSDDWTDMKTKGKAGAVDKTTIGTVTGESAKLITDWVGAGDAVDFKAFTLDTAAKLVFDVNSTDAVKFTVYQLDEAKAGYKLTAKLSSTAIAAPKNGAKQTTVTTKEALLSAGTYYIAVESTNAKKGGSADYTVAVNQKNSKFYPVGDKSNNKWQDASGQKAKLAGEEITGWVGFGDASDFIKFQVAQDGKIQLNLDKSTADALAGKKIKLSCLDKDGKAVAVALDKSNPSTLLSKKDVIAGEYYLGVTCGDVKKYDASYSIKTGLLAG